MEAAMRERPILFSSPMIREILAGQKTQTRRVVKLVGSDTIEERDDGSLWPYCVTWAHGDDGEPWYACPYGEPGDRLWVRETFASFDAPDGSDRTLVAYRATCQNDRLTFIGDATAGGSFAVQEIEVHRWRPAIHMPRWASRLTLVVTSVRVERLQEITEDDARAEGAERAYGEDDRQFTEAEHACGYEPPTSYVAGFAALWRSINGPESWEADPWVWVVNFKRVEVPRE